MTHPLVSAYYRSKQAFKSLEKVTIEEHFLQLRRVLQDCSDLINEVVTSTPSISCFVGFLCGANNKPYAIWLWPLRRLDLEYWHWVSDATYDEVLEDTRCRRIVLPFFLRS